VTRYTTATYVVGTNNESSVHLRVLQFIGAHDHFLSNLSMAACKLMLDAASGVPHSSMVTAMTRNSVNFGIRGSGARVDESLSAPPHVVRVYFAPLLCALVAR
jgi:Protein of unknown function (DUF1116)